MIKTYRSTQTVKAVQITDLNTAKEVLEELFNESGYNCYTTKGYWFSAQQGDYVFINHNGLVKVMSEVHFKEHYQEL